MVTRVYFNLRLGACVAALAGCSGMPGTPELSQKFKDAIPSNPIVSEGSREESIQVDDGEVKTDVDGVTIETQPTETPTNDAVPMCGAAGKGCYGDAAAIAAGVARTPLGKSLVYVPAANGFKVWKDKNSDKILRANGLDEWAMRLNLGGKGFLGAGSEFTSYARLVGRVCPPNVYIDDSNKFISGQCLYYTNEAAPQALDAAGTSQTTAASIGLGSWNVYTSSATWHVGNIKTCSDVGMRLPTIFETSTTSIDGFYDPDTDGNPVFATTNGVPGHTSGGYTWTATASKQANSNYNRWNAGGVASSALNTSSFYVRCVLP